MSSAMCLGVCRKHRPPAKQRKGEAGQRRADVGWHLPELLLQTCTLESSLPHTPSPLHSRHNSLHHRKHAQEVRVAPLNPLLMPLTRVLTPTQRHCPVVAARLRPPETRLPPGIPTQVLRPGHLAAICDDRREQAGQDPPGHWRRRRR